MNKYSNLQPFEDRGRMRGVRQWLNILFIAAAATGMIWYLTGDKETAVWIMIASIVPKFLELTLRIAKL